MNAIIRKIGYSLLVCAIALLGAVPAQAYESPLHIFSIDDLQGGFDGRTYGPAGTMQDPNLICGLSGSPACPWWVQPFMDKEGIMLYPVDSEFGFYVVDFLGAKEKLLDEDFMEGWVGNITDSGQVVGLKVSNAKTDKYKVKPPLGTWCQGLGGTSIKCSTEHYSTMEHVLSCHEVLPYWFADPNDGTQAVLSFPYGDEEFDCANAQLDDVVNIIGGLNDGVRLTDSTPGNQINANDNTTVLQDIAKSSDYSITLKDDGKALYRWGAMIKRPNDIRLYARLKLPEQWKAEDAPEAGYEVTSARLIVNHWITNNPNDQLRPEDLENEAATGRKPSYEVQMDDEDEIWVTRRDCYEGDADFLDVDDDSPDPTLLKAGTVLRNGPFANPAGTDDPLLFSSDLVGGYTNAYYTTINRDPFEWSYRMTDLGDNVHEFVGFEFPLTTTEMGLYNLEFVSGPRWRLKANKFGQDIPGLEIPIQECSPPPFTHDNIRYEVGTMVTTVINLLDWKDEFSPLRNSNGWIDVMQNDVVSPDIEYVNGVAVSRNGLPMTEDFDLAVYIKGDRKPTAVYNAKLEISFVGEIPEVPPEWDVAITSVSYPDIVIEEEPVIISAVIENYGPAPALVNVSLFCVDNRDVTFMPELPTVTIDNDGTAFFTWLLQQDSPQPATLDCTITADAEGDINPINNTVDFKVKVKKEK